MNHSKVRIYLLNKNLGFNKYLLDSTYSKQPVSVSKHKMGSNYHSGIIYIFSKSIPKPSWAADIKKIAAPDSHKDLKYNSNTDYKAIVFLKVFVSLSNQTRQTKTFAITFGRSQMFLNPEYIEDEFANVITRALVSNENVTTLNSVTLDRTIFKTKKIAAKNIPQSKLINRQELSFIKDLSGKTTLMGKKFLVGGGKSLELKGEFRLDKPDLVNLLSDLGTTFFSKATPSFNIKEMLIPVIKSSVVNELNNKLNKKLTSFIIPPTADTKYTALDNRNVRGLSLEIPESIPACNIKNVFISGLGYKNTNSKNVTELSVLEYFDRIRFLNYEDLKLKDADSIIRKMKNSKITIEIDHEDSIEEQTFSVYDCLIFELVHESVSYLFFNKKWYKINDLFYTNLISELEELTDIPNLLPEPVYPNYLNQLEDAWNKNFASSNPGITNMDKSFFNFDLEILNKYNLNSHSKIEICDALRYTEEYVEFIHAKRRGGASGISHLANQAVTSGTLFNEQTHDVIQKLTTIDPSFIFNNQLKSVKLIVLDERFKKSQMHNVLTILESIALVQAARTLKSMGYEVSLKGIG